MKNTSSGKPTNANVAHGASQKVQTRRTASSMSKSAHVTGKKADVTTKQGRASPLSAPNSGQPSRPRGWLQNLRHHAGLIVGGSEHGLRRHGYKLEPTKVGRGGRILSGTDPDGKPAIFADKGAKSYRAEATKRGMIAQGRDVDHVLAKSRLRGGLFSRLQSIGTLPNRSAGRKESRQPKMKGNESVVVAERSMIRKMLNHPQEKSLGSDPKRGSLKQTFNGYAGDAKAALQKNSIATTKAKVPAAPKSSRDLPVKSKANLTKF
ncbi:MAG: hypothetical protein AAF756_15605 [Pseudomonadota bacterium]